MSQAQIKKVKAEGVVCSIYLLSYNVYFHPQIANMATRN